jgi:hypothetical protein
LALKLRLNRRAEETVVQVFGDVESFQKYLNENTCWMFQQQERRYVAGKWVTHPPSPIMLCEKIKLVLSPPRIAYDYSSKDLYYYNRIITVRTPNRDDRADALAGREIKESIEVEPDMPDRPLGPLTPTITMVKRAEERVQETTVTVKNEAAADEKPAKPVPVQNEDRQKFLITPLCPRCSGKLIPKRGTFCQSCGARLPDKFAVNREIVAAIRPSEYKKLADHLKQQLNVAWNQLLKGRRAEQVSSMGQVLLIITVQDETQTSTQAQENRFDELLVETGIGRLTTDPYELREAHAMLANKQQNSAQ